MLEVIQEHPCSYLPNREARLQYRLIEECEAEVYQGLLERGWRRFGQTFFRPVCASCEECRSLRVDVAAFAPSRSMRRSWKQNQDLRVLLRPASISAQHLELYGRYHRDMADRRQWPDKATSAGEYFQTFVVGRQGFGHELLFLLAGELVAVALVDVLPSALSAVYCFYAPEHRARGLGVFSVLTQVELARRHGVPWLYLGYWVEENASMSYKSRYRPHQILAGRPDADEAAVWTAGDRPGGTGSVG